MYDQLDALRAEGIEGRQWVRHHFTFFVNATGAHAAYNELLRLGFPEIISDEELTGGDYWHVIGCRVEQLDPGAVARTRDEMQEIALRLGGEYLGWEVYRRDNGSPFDPDKPTGFENT